MNSHCKSNSPTHYVSNKNKKKIKKTTASDILTSSFLYVYVHYKTVFDFFSEVTRIFYSRVCNSQVYSERLHQKPTEIENQLVVNTPVQHPVRRSKLLPSAWCAPGRTLWSSRSLSVTNIETYKPKVWQDNVYTSTYTLK